MIKSTRKSKVVKVAAAAAALGSLAAIGFVGNSPAQADPKQYTGLVGVGSDTTQEIMNAFAGNATGLAFDPTNQVVRGNEASFFRQIISFDATQPGGQPNVAECIITRVGGPALERPNGSSAGRAAISRLIDGGLFDDKSPDCGPVDASTSVDFARSSSGPSATVPTAPNMLLYYRFATDALSYALYNSAVATTPARPVEPAVASMTRAELRTIFNDRGAAAGADIITLPSATTTRIMPCAIQLGSGTGSFWQTGPLGLTIPTGASGAVQEDNATSDCRALARANNIGDADGRLQENNALQLVQIGNAARLATGALQADQVVIGFSASQYISKSGGLGVPLPPATVTLGAISNNGATPTAVNCGAPVLAGPVINPNFYSNCSSFNRGVFNVVPWSAIYRDNGDPAAGIQEASSFGNDDYKSIFVGNSSAVCQKTALIAQYGFQVFANCGAESRGVLINNVT